MPTEARTVASSALRAVRPSLQDWLPSGLAPLNHWHRLGPVSLRAGRRRCHDRAAVHRCPKVGGFGRICRCRATCRGWATAAGPGTARPSSPMTMPSAPQKLHRDRVPATQGLAPQRIPRWPLSRHHSRHRRHPAIQPMSPDPKSAFSPAIDEHPACLCRGRVHMPGCRFRVAVGDFRRTKANGRRSGEPHSCQPWGRTVTSSTERQPPCHRVTCPCADACSCASPAAGDPAHPCLGGRGDVASTARGRHHVDLR